MTRRLNADAATTFLARFDEPSGAPTDFGPSALVVTNVGTTPEAVADPGVPFSSARRFQRASTQHLWAYSTALHTPAMSFECWFRLNSMPAPSARYFIGGIYSPGWLLGVRNNAGAMELLFLDGSSAYQYVPCPYLNTAQWFYVAATFDTAAKRVYLNGDLLASTAGGTLSYSGGNYFCVGTWMNGTTPQAEGFDGLIAEVRLSNRARRPDEIMNTLLVPRQRDPSYGFRVEP